MILYVYVEEPSAEAALRSIMPRLLPEGWESVYAVFQGKDDLLDKLPSRLKVYKHWPPEQWRILVLVDRDDDECGSLKERLEQMAVGEGLCTKTSAQGQAFQVLNRIAVDELEAWFLGDVEALRAAYPRVPATLRERAAFRTPDSIRGGTWEALARELQKAGYYANPGARKPGMPKIEVARKVSRYMDPERNTSHSFQVFVRGVQALVASVSD